MDLLRFWPWALGALGILAVVGIALSPVAALKLARSVGGFLLEKVRALVEWLRKERPPGWWWRFACVCLAVVCIGFAFVTQEARREVLVVTERCSAQVATIKGEARTASDTAAANARALRSCQLQLDTEVGKRQEVERLAEEAVAAAEAQEAQAQAELTEWQRNYRRRPATCEAALQALEGACPTIESY